MSDRNLKVLKLDRKGAAYSLLDSPGVSSRCLNIVTFQQPVNLGLRIKYLSADGSVRYLPVITIILQGTLADTESTADLLASKINLVADCGTVRVDQHIHNFDGMDDMPAQFFELAAVTGNDNFVHCIIRVL